MRAGTRSGRWRIGELLREEWLKAENVVVEQGQGIGSCLRMRTNAASDETESTPEYPESARKRSGFGAPMGAANCDEGYSQAGQPEAADTKSVIWQSSTVIVPPPLMASAKLREQWAMIAVAFEQGNQCHRIFNSPVRPEHRPRSQIRR